MLGRVKLAGLCGALGQAGTVIRRGERGQADGPVAGPVTQAEPPSRARGLAGGSGEAPVALCLASGA